MKFVAEFTNKKDRFYVIMRDEHGKWYVTNENIYVQRRLNASEIVRYLANALEGK